MEQTILSMAEKNGIFAMMFVFLLFYVLKQNAIREGKYQDVIKSLSDDIQKELTCINTKVEEVCEVVKDFGKKVV